MGEATRYYTRFFLTALAIIAFGTKTQAMTNVRTIAIDAAGAIVARLTGTAPAEGAVASAVDAALKR